MERNKMEEKKIATKSEKRGNIIASNILIEPWITEASTAMGELNKYVFKVSQKSSKRQIKDSIEKVYGVKVVAVNTVSIPRKARKQGRSIGWKAGFRKAIATLKAGDNIDLFGNK
jgi:large subunit ribosomal protein L23